jgi:hypothetical protein
MEISDSFTGAMVGAAFRQTRLEPKRISKRHIGRGASILTQSGLRCDFFPGRIRFSRPSNYAIFRWPSAMADTPDFLFENPAANPFRKWRQGPWQKENHRL